jgi:hypothetical protein
MQFNKSLKLVIFILLLVFTVIFSGCGGGGGITPPINHPPTIVSLTANPPSPIEVNQSTAITCYASDQDNDQLTYSWTKTGGTITGIGSAITWTAPAITGTYIITCTVYDGELSATQDLIVTVEKTTPDWLGIPQIDPDTIFTEEATDVWLTILVNCKPEDLASESPVEIFIQNENAEWILLDEMFDDGDLNNHGDEIKGDRIYSNIIGFYEENSTFIPMKIVVTASDNEQYSIELNLNVVEDISEEIYQEVNEISNLSEQKLSEIMQDPPPDIATVIQMLSDYLVEQAGVESCEVLDNTLELTFDTGVLMEIRLINLDAGEPPEGENLTVKQEDLSLSDNKNREREYIPILLESQTTGEGDVFSDNLSKDTNDYLESKDILGVEYIGNRNVFVYDPFYEFWTYYGHDVGSHYEQLLDNSSIEFIIDIYRDDQADIETLKTMVNYGIVFIHTHGSGKTFATGLEANETSISKYQDEMTKNPREVYISKSLAISWNGNVKVYEDKLGVTTYWFDYSNLPGKLPNSIIFNNSCYNGNELFYNAFDSIGAATYYGHSDTTNRTNAIFCTSEVLEGLIDGKTTGEAYIERANWEILGKENVKIPETVPFSNGGFEEDFINWKKEGDGRIIYALAFIKPTEGEKMGIISTGLGYTEKYGSLSQTFKVGNDDTKLQFDWNYLSEEFIEYIGSVYQDPFKVTLTKVDDSLTTTILNKTVDDIAAEFGASQSNGGDLIYVSPDIVFDIGDVWMTGWQTFEYDISPYQGQIVTLKFEAVDEGDEIYDTAILLDMVNLE